MAVTFYTIRLLYFTFPFPLSLSILQYLMLLIGIIYAMMHIYVYQMMVTFDLSLKDIMRNALIFALGKLPLNILITLICGAIVIASVIFNTVIGIILSAIITLSLIGYIIVFSVYPTIENYLIAPVSVPDDDEDIADFCD